MTTEIVAVTVYPQTARVTRRGRTRLEAGPQRVVGGGLSQDVMPETVRVAARGAATVHGVDVVPEHHPRSPDPGVEELRQRLDALRLRLDELTDLDAVEQAFDAAEARLSVRQASAATAHVDQGVAAATYTPARRVAVPSDGSTHRTTLLVAEFEARLDHVTAPVLAQVAFLRATAVNGSEHTLLPGQASVFHEAEFVGSTRLEPWAPGEEVELALGIDDRVRIERELLRRGAGKVLVGRTRHRDSGYKITVGNYGPRAANITVLDRIPVSRDEGIVVRDVNVSPKPAEQSDLGELTWKLSVEPGATAEITFGFRVDLGKDVEVAGWPS